jgi:hypothetical protein
MEPQTFAEIYDLVLCCRNMGICFNGAADIHLRKSSGPTQSASSQAMLQWSRRHSSAEIKKASETPLVDLLLQWSRRHSSAEILCLFSVVFPKGSVAIFERLGFLLPVQSKKHAQLIPVLS